MKYLLIALLGIFFLTTFQNCSPVSMKPVNAIDSKVDGSGSPDGGDNDADHDGDGNGGTNSDTPSPNDDDEVLVAKCDQLKRNLNKSISLPSGANITDKNGRTIVNAPSLGQIVRVGGTLIAIASSTDAHVEKLSWVHGNMIFCGFSIKSVENFTRGHLVVINGNVGRVDGFRGNIRFVGGGRITGEVTNSNGNF